jgi:hypothetical protein
MPSKLGDDFLRAHSARVRDSYSEHFKTLAFELLSDFADRHGGRRMNEEETNEMMRWLATEALSLGAFAYGRSGGSIDAVLEYVREEFLRSLGAGKREDDSAPKISDATTQD